MSDTPEQTLRDILRGLNSRLSADRLAAFARLQALGKSDLAVLRRTEQLALNDDDRAVRAAAREALALPAHRTLQRGAASLARDSRRRLLRELESWEADELIDPEQAAVLRQRYDFDLPAGVPLVKPAEVKPPSKAAAEAAPAVPAVPAGPRPTLAQTLLSETSIRVALYLGAFFVIAAALILAALVQTARLPILLTATAIFFTGALAIRRRLPQPSFALFIVFSFLMPITANVLEESLGLSENANTVYWIVASLLMAGVWGLGAWMYVSRLFTLAAFVSLDVAFLNFGELFGQNTDFQMEITALMFSLAALAGLIGVSALKRRGDVKSSQILFLLTQIQQLAVVWTAAGAVIVRYFDQRMPLLYWIIAALIFTTAAAFWLWSNALTKFSLFPWFAVAAGIPIAWLAVQTMDPEALGNIVAIMLWGLMAAVASELAGRRAHSKEYSLPLLLAAGVLFVAGSIWGLLEKLDYGFICLLLAALAYAALAVVRPRTAVWTASITAAVAAYFTFFSLPLMESIDLFSGYLVMLPGLALLLPDLLLKADFKDRRPLRAPMRWWGALLIGAAYLVMLPEHTPQKSPIGYGVLAAFFAVYAVRYARRGLGYLATATAVLALGFSLEPLQDDVWLPVLTSLAVLYLVLGHVLRTRDPWSVILRNSALILGAVVALISLAESQPMAGWYGLVLAALFAVELFIRRDDRLSLGLAAMLSIAVYLILGELNIHEVAYVLLALMAVWLGTDAVLHRMFRTARPYARPMQIIGAILAAGITAWALVPDLASARVAWIAFGLSTIFFTAYALEYRRAELGYIPMAYLPLTIAYLLRDVSRIEWLHPTMIIAVLYYGVGWALRSQKRAPGWDQTLLRGGLGVGTLAAVLAPLQGGLDASIAVAVAATLWAVEAFTQRNVWLGFPANALYLLAYFMILIELKVDEPQYFSIGAALLGLLMHYLLNRAGGGTAAFITGMVSQLVLLSTTYIQMINVGELVFFVVLFLQSLAVLAYGLVIRSRSLVFTPVAFAVLGVVTVVYGELRGLSTVFLIGCTGVVLLVLGILAVVMRERIAKLGGQLSGWQA